jgi:hypothetical protein
MPEVLVAFNETIQTGDGLVEARVCGGIAGNGLWEGWLEFRPVGTSTEAEAGWVRSSRETEQPNLDDLRYWAGGLTVAYLQGAYARAANKTPR